MLPGYKGNSTNNLMINYQVDDVEALVEELKKNDVTIRTLSKPLISANLYISLTQKETKLNCGNQR